MAAEAPRLSGYLRRFATDAGRDYDYDAKVAEFAGRFADKTAQRDALRDKLARERTITVRRFSLGFDGLEIPSERLKSIRADVEKYLVNIHRMLYPTAQQPKAGDTPPIQVQEAAYFVYETALDSAVADKESQLVATYGKKDGVYKSLLKQVDNLERRRLALLRLGKDDPKAVELAPRSFPDQRGDNIFAVSGVMDVPFGSDFDIAPPTGAVPEFVYRAPVSEAPRQRAARSLNVAPQTTSIHRSAPATAAADEPRAVSHDIVGLRELCETHLVQTGGQSPFTAPQLVVEIFKVLERGGQDQAVQGDLFNLLGATGIEMISLLLENRTAFVSTGHRQLAELARENAATRKEELDAVLKQPTMGMFSITTAADKALAKQMRKQQKKGGKGAIEAVQLEPAVVEQLFVRHQTRLAEQQSAAQSASTAPVGQVFGGKRAISAASKTALPQGTKRTVFTEHEEVFVPPVKNGGPVSQKDLVPITAFPAWAQLAFRGFTHLNRIQSKVYQCAFGSNENMLICAPTGAGKTNIALMTMLHEVQLHMENGMLRRKDPFKIVYIAPMKALAAEMTANFGKRLKPLGVVVNECTGDMQLTRKQLTETHVIVSTPEKWDVITRKSNDAALAQMVKLLIIDEVHLLHEERGAVIESVVARTLRQVESSQAMIRIVGLSATLPNYQDAAVFLRVSPSTGLFVFDGSYRPVPLEQTFIGVKDVNPSKTASAMNKICYEKVLRSLREGNQCMIFVHSRKATVKTARIMRDLAQEGNTLPLFETAHQHPQHISAAKEVGKSRNIELKELFASGLGVHHAGMMRSDRSLTERLFKDGHLKVLCCTATLAWGVNLPAHTVVINGTKIYNPEKGGFMELGMLDVMQIFGRAGRPQFDTSGEGMIITTHDQLPHYLRLLTSQLPIESQFPRNLPNNLNAEIVLGTVSTVREAVQWLSYTYLYVRMRRNPLEYGISWQEKELDPRLDNHREELVKSAARKLRAARMIRYDEASGNFGITDLGRVASHFYIHYLSVETFNAMLKDQMDDGDLLRVLCSAHEFEQVQVRDDELNELDRLKREVCFIKVKSGVENAVGKVNVLLQAHISRASMDTFSLILDMNYVAKNAQRLLRGLFEMCLKRGRPSLADRFLVIWKMVEKQTWEWQHPLRQMRRITHDIVGRLEAQNATLDKLADMDAKEIGQLVHHVRLGEQIKQAVHQFPFLWLNATVQPITRSVLRVQLEITPEFTWVDALHGMMEPWWVWVEDTENDFIYHSEYFVLQKKDLTEEEPIVLAFTVPIQDVQPHPQYYIRVVSDRWLGAESLVELSFDHLILPSHHAPHTELLDLQPLPLSVLQNAEYPKVFRFSHFNPIQTQLFHVAYHTEHNMLVGAPTGSGKTVSCELAMMHTFNTEPRGKVIYIAPLKALVRERMKDWRARFVQLLGKKMVELTGDVQPDIRSLLAADIVCTTPEKWDGISRNWQTRKYVQDVRLVILDEIHLLGQDRGPILEVIVSRMRYISSQIAKPIRFVGLSTALSNARDLGDWLGIDEVGLFNFRPAVRPVPLEVHIQGYPGKHYCPRMATMNKPCFAAICEHSLKQPVLIFVSSRRQTRLTALDLIGMAAGRDNPRMFLHMPPEDLEPVLATLRDDSLRHTLSFGVGLHHAGLCDHDRDIVEDLFLHNKIQVLVSTSTLAWGVNLPAHLVIVKGTEYFDGKSKGYVDFPITDVLQMMGRAGRPQFDNQGKVVVMVHEPKKSFYKKFLYEPFPVESSLPGVLHDHINAEVVSGTISSRQDAMDYLSWTYFYRRLVMNPSYYGLTSLDPDKVNQFLSGIVQKTLTDLAGAHCLALDGESVEPRTLGRVASFYYLHYKTMRLLHRDVRAGLGVRELVRVMSDCSEYSELPVRHDEDKTNATLAKECRWPVGFLFESSHTKTHILLQCHFGRVAMPVSDYNTDTKSVLDQALRILNAMTDVAADSGFLDTALGCMKLTQMVVQACWDDDDPLDALPHMRKDLRAALAKAGARTVRDVAAMKSAQVVQIAERFLGKQRARAFGRAIDAIPVVELLAPERLQEPIEQGDEAQIQVEIVRRRGSSPKTVQAPRFPKNKEEGWWLVLADPGTHELLALKRLPPFGRSMRTMLRFEANFARGLVQLEVMLVSDGWRGVDHEVAVGIEVV